MGISRNRIVSSRIFAALLLLLILLSSPCVNRDGLPAFILRYTGFVLLSVAAFGRLWCSVFIAGYKTKTLVKEGPYSVVRNPLYLFSFIGAIGLGLATQMVVPVVLIAAAFLLYYPHIVTREEARLEEGFGEEFSAYKKETPKWIPRLSNYQEPLECTVRLRFFRRALLDAVWFIWAFMILELIRRLQEAGIIPVFWKIP